MTPRIVYKVWIDIEEYDVKSESGVLLDCLSIPCTATFRTLDDAQALAMKMHSSFESSPGQVKLEYARRRTR